jgi:Na+(H+)/acetate symporter ActP
MTDRIYWDDLRVAWCATELDAATLSPRLKARLRRQSGLVRAGVFAGAVATAAGLALGAWTSGWGW